MFENLKEILIIILGILSFLRKIDYDEKCRKCGVVNPIDKRSGRGDRLTSLGDIINSFINLFRSGTKGDANK